MDNFYSYKWKLLLLVRVFTMSIAFFKIILNVVYHYNYATGKHVCFIIFILTCRTLAISSVSVIVYV